MEDFNLYYIGIDLGTSAVKLLLTDEKGMILNIVSKEISLSFPHPGWAEQDPSQWLEAAVKGIKELTAGFDKALVAGIGTGGQMHGLVCLDKDDNVIRPAILWNDTRTQKETDYLNNEIGTERLKKLTGNIAFAGFTAPKILWLKENEPENFARISKIMLPKDYVNYCLTGTFATDYSDASGMLLLDVEHKCWSDEMITVCGIKKEMLPELYESYEATGTLKKDIASQLGLSESVKVAAGAGDNAAAAIGTATIGEGSCNISLGTSGTVFISSESFAGDVPEALHSFAHADGSYHVMGCMLSAASCNKWWCEDILKTDGYAKEQENITDEDLGTNHIYYLPYLMGERAPHNDAFARSCFIGMSMDSERKDMMQAVLEGVAFGIRDSLEAAKAAGISVSSSMICGGGAKSALWKKILANVLNIELAEPECEQGAGYGAAILAAAACGEYESVQAGCAGIVKKAAATKPDPEIAARYEEKYQVYKALYPALKGIFPLL